MLYRVLYALLIARVDAETAHEWITRVMAGLGRVPGSRRLIARWAGAPDPCLATEAFGLRFASPLGVAAGLDKDATWFRELGALGFGCVEVGTITAEAQPGNPRPRITRLPRDRALVNSMGFPGAGAAAAERRLRNRRGGPVVAVNVGRTKLAADARADYRASVRRLAPHADLLVLNVSSPNTPGLRDMQSGEILRSLVGDVRAELQTLGRRPPLLVKIAPDLTDGEVDAIADVALELGLDGIVATNTTVDRAGLRSDPDLTDRPGGVSGAPLKARALQVLRRLHARSGGALTLVSVGGIETPEDAVARIRAGATLIQAYTGFVYGGPGWPRAINRGLAAHVRNFGVDSVADLVGTETVV